MVTVFFYLHIFIGSVGRRILLVVPVDTLYRTSIISSSTVLLLNPFANLSLAPLSLFSIYGPDLRVWPDCWVSAEFLRAPIPRKGSGSTTTTTHQVGNCTMHVCSGFQVKPRQFFVYLQRAGSEILVLQRFLNALDNSICRHDRLFDLHPR